MEVEVREHPDQWEMELPIEKRLEKAAYYRRQANLMYGMYGGMTAFIKAQRYHRMADELTVGAIQENNKTKKS